MKSPWTFRQRGQVGKWVSDLLAASGELCRRSDVLPLDGGAQQCAWAGDLSDVDRVSSSRASRPSGRGSATGSASENANLPSFVVLPDRRGLPPCGVANWGNGFLPAAHQGVIFGDETTPIADLQPPSTVNRCAAGGLLRSAYRRSTKSTCSSIQARTRSWPASRAMSWRRECR